MRFGHRVAGEDLALQQRAEVALLLRLGAVVGDDLGVAGVGGLAAEDDRRPLGAAEDLVQQRELDLAVAGAAQVGPEVCGPEALVPDLVLQRVDGPAAVVVQRREGQARPDEVQRLDLLPDELVGPVQLLLELGIGLEVPRHCVPLVGVGRIRF